MSMLPGTIANTTSALEDKKQRQDDETLAQLLQDQFLAEHIACSDSPSWLVALTQTQSHQCEQPAEASFPALADEEHVERLTQALDRKRHKRARRGRRRQTRHCLVTATLNKTLRARHSPAPTPSLNQAAVAPALPSEWPEPIDVDELERQTLEEIISSA